MRALGRILEAIRNFVASRAKSIASKIRVSTVEHEIFECLARHLELTLKAVDDVIALMLTEDEAKAMMLVREVIELEKRGDDIVTKLLDKLFRSTMPAMLYGNYHLLISLVDDILDEVYFIANEIGRAKSAKLDADPRVKAMYNRVLEGLHIARSAIEDLSKMMSVALRNRDEVAYLDRHIDNYEDSVDTLRNELLNEIYRLKPDPLVLHHLVELAQAVDRVLDRCEDAAHLVLLLVNVVLG